MADWNRAEGAGPGRLAGLGPLPPCVCGQLPLLPPWPWPREIKRIYSFENNTRNFSSWEFWSMNFLPRKFGPKSLGSSEFLAKGILYQAF